MLAVFIFELDSHFHSQGKCFTSLILSLFNLFIAIAEVDDSGGGNGGGVVFVLNLSCKPFCTFSGSVVVVFVRFISKIVCFIVCLLLR